MNTDAHLQTLTIAQPLYANEDSPVCRNGQILSSVLPDLIADGLSGLPKYKKKILSLVTLLSAIL